MPLSFALAGATAAVLSARYSRHARAARAARPARAVGGAGAVLVVGGSGRVGGSTARWLRRLSQEEGFADLQLSVGGRSEARHAELAARWGEDASNGPIPAFVPLDLADPASVRAAISGGWSLIVHTAGPFQGVKRPLVLEEAIRQGVPYVDVCDDTELCQAAKSLSPLAEAAGVPAVVSAGIWPGVSALMVAEAVERLGGAAKDVELSFFTAGTGGAGPTIVSATFLLLAEPPLVYRGGSPGRGEPWGDRHLVDFGPGAGQRFVHLLDEPEVYTCHKVLGIPNIRSSFGTAPDVWNWLFGAVRLLPVQLLRNRTLMQGVAVFSMPVISLVDRLVGAVNAMRVDATAADGRSVTLRMTHVDLEDCVGLGTAAFALEVLQGRVPSGVSFPVEMTANRREILRRVRQGTILWEL